MEKPALVMEETNMNFLEREHLYLKDIKAAKEVFWINPNKEVFEKAAEKI